MTERDVREALTSDVLDALHEAHRQPGSITMPELAQAVAAALAPVMVGMLAEAEQRGREDNADHGMCYVHGSKALDARLAEAYQRGYDDGCDDPESIWTSTQEACRAQGRIEGAAEVRARVEAVLADGRSGGYWAGGANGWVRGVREDRIRAALTAEADQ